MNKIKATERGEEKIMNNEVASLMNNEKRIILVNFRRRKLILLYSGGASPHRWKLRD